MANVKKGQLTAAREWWKHLRWTKRDFWKRERRVAKDVATTEAVASRVSGSDSIK